MSETPPALDPKQLLPQERPGSSTSEFKMNALAVLAGLGMIALGLVFGKDALVDNGTYIVIGSAGVYTVSRSLFKAKVGSQ